ncbi:MAG: GrpB family protein [Spirochaetales bacterium]|nr:GrpB family protein [Spirochaetales bacterium]
MNKTLDDLTTEELGKLFPITLSAPQTNWNILFEQERQQLIQVIGESFILRIEHIGSTAIPGIRAKPTIDILAEIGADSNCSQIINGMRNAHYHVIPRPKNPAPHLMFTKGYTIKGYNGQAVHIHMRYPGDWDEIYFRDYLRGNETVAREYEQLKTDLEKKFKYDREAYTEGKTDFVTRISARAKFEHNRRLHDRKQQKTEQTAINGYF